MDTRRFPDLDSLRTVLGEPLGASDWVTIDQDLIDRFADLTFADHWSHVDRERSAAGPFGGTIAQGMLVLSLGPPLARRIFTVDGFGQSLNYGFDKVRFVAPVPVDSRLRVAARVLQVDEVDEADGGARVTTELVFELDGSERPACVAHLLSYYRR